MASSMQFAVDVPGNCCLMICRHGELFIITSGHGAVAGLGRRSTTVFADGFGKLQADIRNRAVPSSIASPCRRVNKVVCEVMMAPKVFLAGNGTFWSIRSVWYWSHLSQPPT